jgi:hypothetical protein
MPPPINRGHAVPEPGIQNLERERTAREVGRQRMESFEAHQPSGGNSIKAFKPQQGDFRR